VLVAVVPARADHRAHGRLALDDDVGAVVLDIESGAGRVGHTPDDHRGHFDRVAGTIIDLECGRVQVVGAQRHLLPLEEGIDPVEAVRAQRAGVAAEEGEDGGDVRLQDAEALAEKDQQGNGQNIEQRGLGRERQRNAERVPGNQPDEGPGSPEQQGKPEGQGEPAGNAQGLFFFRNVAHVELLVAV
jgi:hypothetical protein